jgi:transposase
MAKERQKLTDAQWEKLEALLPKPRKSRKGGRPWADNRMVFEGILWILRTGAPWADLPKRYPSPSTCWRRLKQWEEQGVWLEAWLGNNRRLAVRWDRDIVVYSAFFHIACLLITLRRL